MMSTVGIAKILFCVLFLYSCCHVIQGQMVMDCCLSVSQREIPRHVVIGYQPQVRGQGCSIGAVVFTTRRGLKLCAPTDPTWVTDLMNFMDRLIKKCHETNFKAKHCKKLKHKTP
ncbi:C-C motif chemokine 19a.1 isoform 1-T2 [Salvelinus alpinus]|uniref:C-C motif chemokine n=1 Tax=Salvelinus namaycush TaxID=8040 RepID=A0A8U0TRD1_SALNM|nr:C-C motif chemokine 19a.1 [Salvelinus namaycush]XP_038826404.1 C-C motif chemokine 19a.1 [Salvelinus namaycush]